MKYRTKQKRLVAIMDAFRAKSQRQMFTMREVATWALSNELWPVPKRGDPEKMCLDWERRLETAQA